MRCRTLIAAAGAVVFIGAGLSPLQAQETADPIVGVWQLDTFHVEVVANGSGFVGTVQETAGCYNAGDTIWKISAKTGPDTYKGLHPFFFVNTCNYAGDGKTTWTLAEAATRIDLSGKSPDGKSSDGYTMYRPIDCDAPNAICGDAGDNEIEGTSEDNVIDGGSGNDVIDGGGGNDVIVGGEGNDTMNGGSAEDHVFGGPGDDVIVGDEAPAPTSAAAGYRFLFALQEEEPVPGVDVLEGGEGNDTIDGNGGDDKVDGGIGVDTVEGAEGNDKMAGQAGNDEVSGGDGKDSVLGQAGNDDLAGGAGPDVLKGGGGVNDFDGGPGKDTCVLSNKKDETRSCEKKQRSFQRSFWPYMGFP
jgi:Ca2+-binding RTX toxin-like protein